MPFSGFLQQTPGSTRDSPAIVTAVLGNAMPAALLQLALSMPPTATRRSKAGALTAFHEVDRRDHMSGPRLLGAPPAEGRATSLREIEERYFVVVAAAFTDTLMER